MLPKESLAPITWRSGQSTFLGVKTWEAGNKTSSQGGTVLFFPGARVHD